ncbi:HpcH/HpaI aldolase family protein [Rummeliibacillus sp. JY-2-4R]
MTSNNQMTFKQKLQSQKPQLGTFVKVNAPEFISILGLSGFQFIIIDMEHTTLTFRDAEDMTRAAHLAGLHSIIRIPDHSGSSILKALDLGADGIQVPQLNNVSEVSQVIDRAKYLPIGSRGLTYGHRAASYGYQPTNYMEQENENTVVSIHIETESAFNNLKEFTSVEHADLFFIGPLDLSVSLQTDSNFISGGLKNPVEAILRTCKENEKLVGIAVNNMEQYQFALENNIPYIVWGSDVSFFKDYTQALTTNINNRR